MPYMAGPISNSGTRDDGNNSSNPTREAAATSTAPELGTSSPTAPAAMSKTPSKAALAKLSSMRAGSNNKNPSPSSRIAASVVPATAPPGVPAAAPAAAPTAPAAAPATAPAPTAPAPTAPASTSERMYSARQLTEALKSGLAAVREQLQVLAILDGTALSWPGVERAVEDMAFLTDMAGGTLARVEGANAGLQVRLDEATAETSTLRASLAACSAAREQAERQLGEVGEELRGVRQEAEEAREEAAQARHEVWTLEKQRADLASELERCRQELEGEQAEARALRTQVSEQSAQLSSLKEELAARRADVGHLRTQAGDQRAAAEAARLQAAAAAEAAAAAQSSLQHVRSEKQHYEKEAGRLAEECSRLGGELERSARETTRLREWQEVVKKVEADKLREEAAAHARTRSEAEGRAAQADQREAVLRAELAAGQDKLVSREAELEAQRRTLGLLQLQVKDLQKQLSLCQGERAAAGRAREGQAAEVAKLQAELQQLRLEGAGRDTERALAGAAAREAAAVERAKLQAQLDEAAKEAALSRAMAEGWQRELREARRALAAEQQRGAAAAKEMEAVRSQLSEGRVEVVRSGAAAEGQLAGLRAQMAAKEEEVRRVKYDAASVQKQLQKAIERLQREVDASATEVARLKAAEDPAFIRLPPVARAATIHDELEALRKALRDRMAGGGGGGGIGTASAGLAGPHARWAGAASAPDSNQAAAAAVASPTAMLLPPMAALLPVSYGLASAATAGGAASNGLVDRVPYPRHKTR